MLLLSSFFFSSFPCFFFPRTTTMHCNSSFYTICWCFLL
jgi:hypothetical protein